MRVPSLTRSLSTFLGRGDSERLSSFICSCSNIVAQLGLGVSSEPEHEGPWQSLPVELVERIAAVRQLASTESNCFLVLQRHACRAGCP